MSSVNNNIFNAMIMVIEEYGAKFIKVDGSFIYFDLFSDTKLTQEILSRANQGFKEGFGLTMKIKRLPWPKKEDI